MPANVSWLIGQNVRTQVGGWVSVILRAWWASTLQRTQYAEKLAVFQRILTTRNSPSSSHAEAIILVKLAQSKLLLPHMQVTSATTTNKKLTGMWCESNSFTMESSVEDTLHLGAVKDYGENAMFLM
jgi:hypothetical protein